MVLENPIDDMDVVEDAQEDRRVLGVQPAEVLGGCLIQAAIRPLFAVNEE
jgi:hypothetical protein